MTIAKEITDALESIGIWKRLKGVPAEVDALRERIAALEQRLAPRTGDACPKCRAMHFTLIDSRPDPGPFGRLGARQYTYRCSACSYEDVRDKER